MILTGHYVTKRGAANLIIGGGKPKEGQPVDVTGWPTLPTLISQGYIQFIPEEIDRPLSATQGGPLWDKFPHKDDLEAAGVRTVQQVYWLTDKELEDLPGIGEVGVTNIRRAVAIFRAEKWPPEVELPVGAALLTALQGNGHLVLWDGQLEDEGSFAALVADALNPKAALTNLLMQLLEHEEAQLLLLSREETDPAVILEGLKDQDGAYKLSAPLMILLDRLGLQYPAPQPPAPEEPVTADPAPQHPTTDPEPASDAGAAAETTDDPSADEKSKGKSRSGKK